MSFKTAAPFLLIFLSITGCTQKADVTAPPRYAVLRFENLTGDAALEWVARGASEILARSLSRALDGPVLTTASVNRKSSLLGPRPTASPGLSTEKDAASAAGANRLISGYIAKEARGLRVTVAIEHGGTFSESGGNAIEALEKVARRISPTAKPPITRNPEVLRLYISGVESAGPAATEVLRAAVTADPDFGPAWTMLVRANMAAGDKAAAESAIEEAARRKLDPLETANLRFESATLKGDVKTRLSSLNAILAESPGDQDLPPLIAEAQAVTGDFAGAAAGWDKVTRASPLNLNAWNQLGYTRAWSGDREGAIAAMREYVRMRPTDANALDSLGDVQYLFAKYADASESYAKAASLDPNFQNGGEFYKQAWAKFQANDRAAGDALIAQFQTARQKANSLSILLESDWLYRTGRAPAAVALLRNEAAKLADPKLRALIFSQLTVWDLLSGDRAAAAKDAEGIGTPNSTATLVARFTALPSASPAEWETRAAKFVSGPQAEPLRNLALAYALLLDKHKTEARLYWDRVAAAAPATDFFTRAIAAKLQGAKPIALLPDPNSVNQFAALPGTL